MKAGFRLPPVGSRIIKSAVGVLLCWCVYLLRGRNGIPFYSMLAALWCIQPYVAKTRSMALQRTIGTFIGAAFGLITIVLEIYAFNIYDQPLGFLVVADDNSGDLHDRAYKASERELFFLRCVSVHNGHSHDGRKPVHVCAEPRS